MLDAAWARRWLLECADALAAAQDLLTELDRQIGDGDHGFNMSRGFTALTAKLAENDSATPGDSIAEETVADVLKLAAATLLSTVGGAAGPLYGTAFLQMAKAAGGAQQLDATAVVDLLDAALTGLKKRGKATPGEKTMVDAWYAAAAAAEMTQTEESQDEEACCDARDRSDPADPPAVLRAAAQAANEAATATIPLLATKGRASYLGERSIGHEDPGARSTAIILTAAVTATCCESEGGER